MVTITQQELDLASRLVVTRMMDMMANKESVRSLDLLWDALSGWKPLPMSLRYWSAQRQLSLALIARDEASAKIRAFGAQLRDTFRPDPNKEYRYE